MAWIEFHPTKLKRLQKFGALRRDLQWSVNETLGFLGSFWGEALDLAEAGDISRWNPAYLCDLTNVGLDPDRVWDALVKNDWLDAGNAGRVLIHDWLDFAGRYLKRKYGTSDPGRLATIWTLHGRVYATEETDKCSPSDTKAIPPNPTKPDETKPKKREEASAPVAPVPVIEIPADLMASEKEVRDWLEYKRQKGQRYKSGKGLDALWRMFRAIPVERRRDAVDHSMANNWAGLYEKKNGGTNGTQRTAGYAEASPGKYPD